MRRIQIGMLTALAVALVFSVLASTASAQALKIGFVDDERIKQEYKAWQRAQEQWEIERTAWDEEATTRQTELQEIIDEYDKQKLILSEEKRREREATIRTKSEALDVYTKQIYAPGGTAERKQEELILPLLERVTEAIRLLAEEESYDVVFTMQSGLGYIRESYDVTDKVLEYLDKLEE